MKKIVYILTLITMFISGVVVYKPAASAHSKSEKSELLGEVYVATAYCLRGTTASGKKVRLGIVAADRRLHRLGSRIMVNQAGAYSGSYHVEDTGSAIRGNRIDIWVPSCKTARQFGVRKVFVKKLG